jgi:hypothetical protein
LVIAFAAVLITGFTTLPAPYYPEDLPDFIKVDKVIIVPAQRSLSRWVSKKFHALELAPKPTLRLVLSVGSASFVIELIASLAGLGHHLNEKSPHVSGSGTELVPEVVRAVWSMERRNCRFVTTAVAFLFHSYFFIHLHLASAKPDFRR